MLKLWGLSMAIQILVEAAAKQEWQRRLVGLSSPDRGNSAESDNDRYLLILTLR